jgi:transposase
VVTPEDSARIAELEAELVRVNAEREHYRELYLKTMELCRKLELGLVGPKRENSTQESQLAMAILGELLQRPVETPPPAASASEQPRERKKPTGRKPLPAELPRVEIEVLPPEVQREGLDAFEVIGEETSEIVERRVASLVVVRIVRRKFVRRDRERNDETEVAIGEPPELPITRGIAGPALMADTVVRRWQDHLPLYRLEQVYAREGLPLARSTICGWHQELHLLVAPLVLAMWKDALASPYLCADASGVLVQADEKCKRGHFWVVVAPERHVLYAYSRTHDSDAVDRILGDYRGHLVVDAHSVYDHLFVDGRIVEVGCWAHARRYFWKALDSEPDKAREALALINELFRGGSRMHRPANDARSASGPRARW